MDSPLPRFKRDPLKTKERILRAAQSVFAGSGYASVGIRDIAQEAGVNSALISRYFGSKANLFETALLDAFSTRAIFVQERENFGERVVELLLNAVDGPLPNMTILATGDPVSREIVQRIANEYMVDHLAEWMGSPDARARALNMIALMTGFAIYIHQLAIRPIPDASISWLVTQVQNIVDNV